MRTLIGLRNRFHPIAVLARFIISLTIKGNTLTLIDVESGKNSGKKGCPFPYFLRNEKRELRLNPIPPNANDLMDKDKLLYAYCSPHTKKQLRLTLL